MPPPVRKVPFGLADKLRRVHRLKKAVENEENNLILSAYAEGASAAEIAKHVNSTKDRVLRLVRNSRIK